MRSIPCAAVGPRQEGLAAHALRVSLLVFGQLLELSERAVRHGLEQQVITLYANCSAMETVGEEQSP